MRWALAIEYLGCAGHGWQSQKNGTGIADSLAEALAGVSGQAPKLICAGRTDSGVHAFRQVVHFDLDRAQSLSARNWLMGANRLLPADIRIHWSRRVPEDFSARFSALHRTYLYALWNGPVLPAFWHGRAALEERPLDIAAMQRAADSLIGEHDFASFRSSRCSSKSTVRQLHCLRVDSQGSLVLLQIRANAFLQRMARILVGCLVQVGLRQWSEQRPLQVLQAQDRTLAADTAVAEGLYFVGPEYAPSFALPPLPEAASLLTGCR